MHQEGFGRHGSQPLCTQSMEQETNLKDRGGVPPMTFFHAMAYEENTGMTRGNPVKKSAETETYLLLGTIESLSSKPP